MLIPELVYLMLVMGHAVSMQGQYNLATFALFCPCPTSDDIEGEI